MSRFLLEIIIWFIVAFAARAILRSVVRGAANAARTANDPRRPENDQPASPPRSSKPARERVAVAGELHKDPVCGMYVAESTEYKRRSGREIVYYCSEKCKELDAVTSRA